MKIHLVACTKNKLSHRAPAKDLYCSSWFNKAKTYCDLAGDPWFILSAMHGLVHPLTELNPYDKYMTGDRLGHSTWIDLVKRDLKPVLDGSKDPQVVIFAGERYRRKMVPWLESHSIPYEIPLSGLGIGYQLQWFNRENERQRSLLRH